MNKNLELLALMRDKFSEDDCALIGCRADSEIHSYECCEYNIVSINELADQKLQFSTGVLFGQSEAKIPIFEVIKISRDLFYENTNLCYSDYVPFYMSSLRSTSTDHFKRKNELYRQSIEFINRSEIIRNIYNIHTIANTLDRENSNIDLLSLDVKICSLKTLRDYLQWYLKKELRPSHIRSQIKLVFDNEGSKVGEVITSLLELIGSERANKSTLSRSEKSIMMLSNKDNQSRLSLIAKKINYFKFNSMYFDAMLLVWDFATQYYRGTQCNKRYNEVLKRVIDVQNKEKITLLEEMKLLLKFNKNLL